MKTGDIVSERGIEGGEAREKECRRLKENKEGISSDMLINGILEFFLLKVKYYMKNARLFKATTAKIPYKAKRVHKTINSFFFFLSH